MDTNGKMARAMERLAFPDFERVRQDRVRHLPSGLVVEHGYVYKEGHLDVIDEQTGERITRILITDFSPDPVSILQIELNAARSA